MKILLTIVLSLFTVSTTLAAGARFKPHSCRFAIPRSNGEIFTGYGATRNEAQRDALRVCKAYHERMIPGICENYYILELEHPGTYMSCKYNPRWEI